MSGPNLENYIEVHERIAAFHRTFPEGSLQGSFEIRDLQIGTFLIYCAKAYRTPDDKRPGIGYAWEPLPGLTPYTKSSELMVGETSAWGRALAALGFEVSRAIASREEVSARQGNGDTPRVRNPDEKATGPQKGKVTRELKEHIPSEYHDQIREAFKADTKGGASALIEELVKGNAMVAYRKAGITPPSDVPADTTGLDADPGPEGGTLDLRTDDGE